VNSIYGNVPGVLQREIVDHIELVRKGKRRKEREGERGAGGKNCVIERQFKLQRICTVTCI
jgi:hypothetical protein